MAYGMKVKKMVVTQITFSASSNLEAKESEIYKTHECLHCGVLFAR